MTHKARLPLVGYDCPLGRYPAPARPIVANHDDSNQDYPYMAVYLDDDLQMELEFVHANSEFTKLSSSQKKELKLDNFDCRKHRLFALAESDVRFYEPQYEDLFFEQLLFDASFSCEDPFFRVSLSKKIKDQTVLERELNSAEIYLQKNDKNLLWFLEKEKFELNKTNNPLVSFPKNSILLRKILENPRGFHNIIFSIPSVSSELLAVSQPYVRNSKPFSQSLIKILYWNELSSA